MFFIGYVPRNKLKEVLWELALESGKRKETMFYDAGWFTYEIRAINKYEK